MRRQAASWTCLAVCLGLGGSGVIAAEPSGMTGGAPAVEIARVLPMESIVPELRGEVAEIIEKHHFHHKGSSETFPCHPKVYLGLLNQPVLTLALWQDLSPSPARLWEVGPGSYQGTDGNGTTATWKFAYRSPQLHVLLGSLHYEGPRGATQLDGRLVLIVRTSFFKEANGAPWIQHEIEAFVKVDSKGWRAVARTVRPLIERLLDDQIKEAGWFVSLMGRLVEEHPDWAVQVAAGRPDLSEATRQEFGVCVAENRRPGASTGRPMLASEPGGGARR